MLLEAYSIAIRGALAAVIAWCAFGYVVAGNDHRIQIFFSATVAMGLFFVFSPFATQLNRKSRRTAVLISPFSRSAERQQQSDMMIGMRLLTAAAAATTLIFTALAPSWADEEFWAAVMRELPEASVSLDQALKTSEQEGKPISAEYDVEDGDFQISVYVEKDGHFREVIIDPQSGTINMTKPLTVAREVDEAQAQSAALRRAKLPLTAALATAEDLNSGYRAVSIIPLLGDGEVVVAITLIKGEAIKQVSQKLN